MGIESRDYLRNESGGGYYNSFNRNSGGWAIKYLLIANIAVFLVLYFSGKTNALYIRSFFELDRSSIFPSFQIWRFVTYGFCHSLAPMHIAFNMFVLWMFGRVVEPVLGSREFIAFYLAGIVVSGICHIAISGAPVVGASGGVMSVVFLTAMCYPRMTVLLMFIIPVELRWVAVLYALLDVFGVINPGTDNVAHVAHLGGAAFGVAYKYWGWNLTAGFNTRWNKFKLNRSARSKNLRVYSEPDTKISNARLDEQVDMVLEKISREGEASLTDQERALLKDASNKYKKR